MRKFIQLVGGFKNRMPRGTVVLLWLHIVSLAIGIGTIICIGPSLQTYLSSLLASPEANIYSTAYGDTLVKFGPLTDWFKGGMFWLYIPLSMLFVYSTRRIDDCRGIFLVGSVYFAAALTVSDLCLALFPKSNINIFQSVVANVIGAPFIAGYGIFLYQLTDQVLDYTDDHKIIKRILAVIGPVALSLLIYAGSYYVFLLFYNPTSTKVDVVISSDAGGFYSEEAVKPTDGAARHRDQFGIFSGDSSFHGSFDIINTKQPVFIHWKRDDKNEKFKVTLMPYSGCETSELPDSKVDGSDAAILEDVESLSIATDVGPSAVSLLSSEEDQGKLSMENNETNMYSLQEDIKTKLITLVRMAPQKAVVQYWSQKGTMKVLLSAFLLKQDTTAALSPTPRKVSIVVNGEPREISFRVRHPADPKAKTACKPMIGSGLDRAGATISLDAESIGGLLLTISRESPSGNIYLKKRDVINVDSSGGSMASIGALSNQEAMGLTQRGWVGMIAISRGIKYLTMNGAKVDMQPFQTVTLDDAHLFGAVEQDGQLRFYGTAGSIFRDQARLNKTRWERLDGSVRLALIPASVACLGVVFTFVINALKKRKKVGVFKRLDDAAR